MKTVSALYRKLLADPEHVRESLVQIDGVEYGQHKIFSCEVNDDLLPEAVIGSCVAHTVSLTVESVEAIPKMARIETFFRLAHGDEASEWIPDGVFFIDTRNLDEASGLLTVEGYDAMLKAEETWLDPTVDTGEWPMNQIAAADDIARRMGTTVDPRSSVDPALAVEYPNDLTMREVLSHIASANCGNWTMNGVGELLLIPLGGLPSETCLLVDEEDGGAIRFGEVRIVVG